MKKMADNAQKPLFEILGHPRVSKQLKEVYEYSDETEKMREGPVNY